MQSKIVAHARKSDLKCTLRSLLSVDRRLNDGYIVVSTIHARPRPICRAAVGMGIPMGIPMGMGMVWVWGL